MSVEVRKAMQQEENREMFLQAMANEKDWSKLGQITLEQLSQDIREHNWVTETLASPASVEIVDGVEALFRMEGDETVHRAGISTIEGTVWETLKQLREEAQPFSAGYIQALEILSVYWERKLFQRLYAATMHHRLPHPEIQNGIYAGTASLQMFRMLYDDMLERDPEEIVPTRCYLGRALWLDLISDKDFSREFDPVITSEELINGHLGNLFGVEFHSDAYRHPLHQVLHPNVLYLVAQPDQLGTYWWSDPEVVSVSEQRQDLRRGFKFSRQCALAVTKNNVRKLQFARS